MKKKSQTKKIPTKQMKKASVRDNPIMRKEVNAVRTLRGIRR